jgi:GT2 family glycosyltransferase
MERTPDVSIIVVNYNARVLLEACLTSIDQQVKGLACEVVVIDNGSTDGSLEAVQARFPHVLVIANGTNLGYSRAVNQGLRVARGRYLLLLNNDAVVQPLAVEKLVAFLEARPQAGMVGCKVLNPDRSIQETARAFPSPLNALFGRKTLLTRLFPHNRFYQRYIISRPGSVAHAVEVDWVSAACALVRRQAIQEVGALDEGFFLYFVDTDWCRRLKERGWQIYYDPEAEIIHHEHQGGSRHSRWHAARMAVVMHRGAYRYYCKHHVKSPWHPMRLVALLGLSMKGSVAVAMEMLQGGQR